MPIFFGSDTKFFSIETLNIKYIFRIVKGKYPIHLRTEL